MLKRVIFAVMVLSMSLFAGQINIAVAANVSYAIGDLIKEFNKTNPHTEVLVTLGSSGKLTAQIKNGAPFHLFMAANMKFPQALYDEKMAITKPIVYAQGSLAMLSSKELDFSQGIEIVAQKEIEKIAIANPKTAPYGAAALEAITNAKLLSSVESKFVYAESISQTVSYAITAADIGFIAKSSMYSDKMSKYKENVNWASVDSSLYTPIDQGVVLTSMAKENLEAKAFYEFILSSKAKEIFKEYGYIVK
jgi:molybdate transport system substrate-binding protein